MTSPDGHALMLGAPAECGQISRSWRASTRAAARGLSEPPCGRADLGQRRSNRSSSMTLTQAATKSRTNFSCASSLRVDLRDRPELGVRAEDQVDRGGGPLELAGGDVADLEDVLGRLRRLPLRAGGEQVHEEVVGQRLATVGEDAVLGPADVRAQGPHAADQHRHLRSGEVEQVGAVEQQRLRRELLPGPQVVAEAVGPRLEHGERLGVGLLLGGVGAARRGTGR